MLKIEYLLFIVNFTGNITLTQIKNDQRVDKQKLTKLS